MAARAEKRCDFALVFGKFDTLCRRAANGRPYIIIITLYFKRQFETEVIYDP